MPSMTFCANRRTPKRSGDAPTEPKRAILRRERRELEIRLVDEGLWEITGTGIERLIAMTDMESEEGGGALAANARTHGDFCDLRERGVKEGDPVRIRGIELEYVE